MPWMLSAMNHFGKYDGRSNLYVCLSQTSLLILCILMLIRVYWFVSKSVFLGSICSETRVGQEMYRLIIFYFIIIILVNTIMETIWIKLLGSLNFDISRNTTNLIYCQMVTCLGFYNSPMLPILTTVILILTFYIQRFSLWMNFENAKKTWTTTTTKTVYLIITFFAIFFPLGFFVYTITKDVESECGPFLRGKSPIEETGFHTDSESVTTYLFSGAIWAGIATSLVVFLYYIWSSAKQKEQLGRTLKRELRSDIKELRQLQRECKAYNIADD